MVRHFNKIKPCGDGKPINVTNYFDQLIMKKFKCTNCLKSFDHINNMYRHRKKCKNNVVNEIEYLKAKLEEVINKLLFYESNGSIKTTNIQQQNIIKKQNNNVNIIFNAYGSDKYNTSKENLCELLQNSAIPLIKY
jgi:hypothetical protein